MTERRDRAVVLCFGEMLWDSLPTGLFPGGAPMNVAYHLHQLGLRAAPVSAVGQDTLGDELIRRVTAWGLDTKLIGVRVDKPTGLVRVKTEKGGPAYSIDELLVQNFVDVPPLQIFPTTLVNQNASGFRCLLSGAPDNNNYYLKWRVVP